MASLSKDGNGWRIQFTCPATKKRRTIRTGRCAKKRAQTAKNMVEKLLEAKSLGTAIDRQAAAWLVSIDGTQLKDRLAKAGLATAVRVTLLGPFIEKYTKSRNDVSSGTKTVWSQGETSLKEFFGKDRPVHTVSHAEAEDFKQWLIGQGRASYTVRKRLQVSKMYFNAMVNRGIISSNPFDGVQVKAVIDESRNVYVSRADAAAVMEEAPDAEWRAMIALSRFGGLRLPSEVLSLKWEYINWEKERITVISPKTAHNPGGGQRVIPLFPELVRPLTEAFDAATDGAVYVVTRHRSQAESPDGWKNSNLRTRFYKMVRRAGLTVWPKPFHAMRASCKTDLIEMRYPIQTVASWMGHSPKVALANYLRVLPEHFDRATSTGAMLQEDLTHYPAHQPHVSPNQGSSEKSQNPVLTGQQEHCGAVETPLTDGKGFEPLVQFPTQQFSRLPP